MSGVADKWLGAPAPAPYILIAPLVLSEAAAFEDALPAVPRLQHRRAGAMTRSADSAHESVVLALMAEGRSNSGIARRLWVAEGTVEKHVRSISPS
jgi:DNA-binding NarL/FixJ family response regulator